ncbi:unnamed protein product, partial [Ectocarpus sp. 4 AP-2014]
TTSNTSFGFLACCFCSYKHFFFCIECMHCFFAYSRCFHDASTNKSGYIFHPPPTGSLLRTQHRFFRVNLLHPQLTTSYASPARKITGGLHPQITTLILFLMSWRLKYSLFVHTLLRHEQLRTHLLPSFPTPSLLLLILFSEFFSHLPSS